MASRVESGPTGVRVIFEGALGVSDAPVLAEHLADALASDQPVSLDLGEAASLDASVIQLVLSARASAEKSGLPLRLGFYGYALEGALHQLGLARLLDDPWFAEAEKVQYFLFADDGEAA